jgi:hypothetical protein
MLSKVCVVEFSGPVSVEEFSKHVNDFARARNIEAKTHIGLHEDDALIVAMHKDFIDRKDDFKPGEGIFPIYKNKR